MMRINVLILLFCMALVMFSAGCSTLTRWADDYGYFTEDETTSQSVKTVAENIGTLVKNQVQKSPFAPFAVPIGLVVSTLIGVFAGVFAGAKRRKGGR